MTRHLNTYGYPNYTCDGCGVVAVRKAWRHLRFSTGYVDHPATWISFDQVLQILRKDAESIKPYIVTTLSPLA